jgi:hypothetical protein
LKRMELPMRRPDGGGHVRAMSFGLAVVASCVLLAACGGAVSTPAPSPSGSAVNIGTKVDPRCLYYSPSGPGLEKATRLPAHAVVVEALRCTYTYPKLGGNPTAVTELRARSGLAALVAALKAPDVLGPPNEVCSMVGVIPPPLWVLTAQGQWLRPIWPIKGCGSNPRTQAALKTVPFVVTAVQTG